MENETELRRQILQLEFQHKKEIAEIREIQAKTQQQLDHITQLTGFAFEELEFNNQKMREAGEILTRKK